MVFVDSFQVPTLYIRMDNRGIVSSNLVQLNASLGLASIDHLSCWNTQTFPALYSTQSYEAELDYGALHWVHCGELLSPLVINQHSVCIHSPRRTERGKVTEVLTVMSQ